MLCLNRANKRTRYTQFLEEYIAALTHFTLHRLYFSQNTNSYETHYLFDNGEMEYYSFTGLIMSNVKANYECLSFKHSALLVRYLISIAFTFSCRMN